VGPPPPGATRGLGVLAFCCQPPVYASQQPLSMIVNASARRSIHPSAWKANSSKFISLAENSSVSWQPPVEFGEWCGADAVDQHRGAYDEGPLLSTVSSVARRLPRDSTYSCATV